MLRLCCRTDAQAFLEQWIEQAGRRTNRTVVISAVKQWRAKLFALLVIAVSFFLC